ncbi:anthranilate synthase component I family protein [Gracilimonas sediminicola]|uniref:Anthranilate synthase component I family protein n=1 Tax=Gracilimonas sediminicola TaxID=2952158 RepID=A0A9X2REV9_9BACT|nr:anthranilate synthase component I family protein [Gracilimonas sediminicola]MCP9292240.1 anthranilate synthase component I family protein [Gracilimonas sediminicola]
MKKAELYISALVRRSRDAGDVILLESQMPGHPASTKSYLAMQPSAWIKARGSEIEVWDGESVQAFKGDPWDYLSRFKKEHNEWLFGYLGYDLKNNVENLQSDNKELINAPDLYFMVPGTLIEIDAAGKVKFVKGELNEALRKGLEPGEISITPKRQISESEYIRKVEQAKKDIYEGRYYEINLSHPLEFEIKGDSWDLYEAMKAAGPVPFGGYANIVGLSICCSSPERFLARTANRVWSQPIKGTASRKAGDKALLDVEKLRQSEKERAENLMIVDLVRNDLSRVAETQSVKVSNLFEIQSFETVHQMVSTVECTVPVHTDSIEIIKSCFPMGSMTGAPKIASMKAIEKYEDYKRGIYSGAMGYIRPNGDFDFNVVIRTAISEGDKLVYPVGGAITSDSDPKAEWEETLIKARAITNIFENFEEAE